MAITRQWARLSAGTRRGIVAGVALLGLGAWAYSLLPAKSDCPAVIAYPGTRSIMIMHGRDRAFRAVQTATGREGTNDRKILGYDRASDTWVYLDKQTNRLIRNRRGSEKVVVLEGNLPSDGLQDVLMLGNKLYDMFLATDDSYHIVRYGLDGRSEHDCKLQTPKPAQLDPEEPDNGYDVSRTGAVAVVLTLKHPKATYMYLFDNRGRFVRRIRRGSDPLYDPSGRWLAFADYEWVFEPRPGGSVQYSRGTHDTMVYDTKSGMTRIIPDAESWSLAGGIPLRTTSTTVMHWSPDGRWLIGYRCGYPLGLWGDGDSPRILYTLDLRARRPKWDELREVPFGDWTVVDWQRSELH